MRVRHGRTLALLVLGLAAPLSPLSAQDPCPSASVAHADAGWTAYSSNDMEAARRHFLAALSRCDNDQYARTGLGYVNLREGDEPAAESSFRTVLDAEPNNVDALVGMGLVCWRVGDTDRVRTHFERVLMLSPDHPTAVDYLGRLNAAQGVGPTDPADEAWRAGNTATAMRLYRARLEANPDDRTAMLRVALMTAWQERYAEAIEMLDRLIDLQPENLDARLARARVRAWSGDIPTAQREAAEVLAVEPSNSEALEALATFQAWAGQFEEALESYDELLSISPGISGFERGQAQVLAWASDFEASREAYDAILERDPDDVEARLGLARTLAYAQDFDEALQQYDRILDGAPTSIAAMTGRARALGWAGRLAASERAARDAVEADGESVEAWAMLGLVFRWQGRLADAKEAYERAAELSPTNADVREQLQAVDRALAPVARPSVTYESDSDDNRMITTSANGRWHPVPRLEVEGAFVWRDLEQFLLFRQVLGASVRGHYLLPSGWTVGAGLGVSGADGGVAPSVFEYEASVKTPERHSAVATVGFARSALNYTAVMAEVGTASSELFVVGRWLPASGWRVDGRIAIGSYDGSEANGRRALFLSGTRRIGRAYSVGVSLRGFSFEKNLDDGYFDPDFYGIAELTGHWLHRTGPWTLVAELAPGVQQMRSDGPVSTTIRTHLRAAYLLSPGRDVFLALRYSSAGLVSFATAAADYRYTSVSLGSRWTF